MRSLGLFIILISLSFGANAKIEFNTLIDESSAQRTATAADVSRRPASHDLVPNEDSQEFSIKLKKIKKKNPAVKGTAKRAVANDKNRVSKKTSKKNNTSARNDGP